MIGVLAEKYCQEQSRIYDLGCSLGGATLAAVDRVECQDFSTIAIDNSAAMIDRLQIKLGICRDSLVRLSVGVKTCVAQR